MKLFESNFEDVPKIPSNETIQRNQLHVGFLRHNLRAKSEDNYTIDMIFALLHFGHKVSIFTASLEEDYSLETCAKVEDLKICYSGWWLPDKIFGKFGKIIGKFKAIWMAVRMLFIPSPSRPKLLVLDTDTIPLLIFYLFSNYNTLFVHHFSQLLAAESFSDRTKINPGLFTLKTLTCADEIVVQTKYFAKVFERSYPNFPKRKLTVAYPCAHTHLLEEDLIDIGNILPDIGKEDSFFVCFGDYQRKSNFHLALAALKTCYSFFENLKRSIQLVIVGSYDPSNHSHAKYYNELIDIAKSKPFANQVTFLANVPITHKVSILNACTAVLHLVQDDFYPNSVIAAMSMSKPIIALNSGFAQEILVHRITGILLEADPSKIGKVMGKLVQTPSLRTFLGNMCHKLYLEHFSFDVFANNFNETVVSVCNNG